MAAPIGDIGVGEAFVIDTSAFDNALSSQLQKFEVQAQQRRKQIQDQNAAIGEIMSKINLNGVRREDQPLILDAYRELRQKAIDAQNQQDPLQKSRSIAEVQNGYADLNAAINGSKQVGAFFADRGKDITENPQRYSQQVIDTFKANAGKPSNELTTDDLDITNYLKRPDTSKAYNEIVSGLQSIVKNQQGSVSTGQTLRIGNQTATQVNTIKQLPPDKAANWILKYAQANPTIEAYLEETYPGMNIGTAAVNLAQELSQIGGILESADTRTQNNARPRSSGSGTTARQQEQSYREQHIQGLIQGDDWAVNDLLGAIPRGTSGQEPTINYTTLPNGHRAIEINSPISLTTTGGVRLGTSETIDLQDGQAVSQLNRILSAVTGQNVSLGSSRIEGGRPRGPLNNLNPDQNSVSSQQQFIGVPKGGF